MNRDAAIEAGARVLHEQWQTSMGVPPGVVTFDDESESLKELIRQQAAAVIDAATPSIQAQALRDAAETVRRYNLPDTPGSMYPFAVADALCERADRIELP